VLFEPLSFKLVLADRYALLRDLMRASDGGVTHAHWKAPPLAPHVDAPTAERLKALYEHVNAKTRQVTNGNGRAHVELPRLDGARDETEAALRKLVEAKALIRRACGHSAKLPWSMVVVDEATRREPRATTLSDTRLSPRARVC
jgi:hypothetical protein